MATRIERISKAADDCRVNAYDTALEQVGMKKWQSMNFNDQLSAVNEQIIAQAGYFADENNVMRAEVLKALYVEE